MKMTDQAKVIDALKNCTTKPKCRDCPWETCESDHEYVELPMDLAKQALALLEAQEPQLMTWREVIGAALMCIPVYIEVRDDEDKEPGDDRWAMVTQYKDSITNGMIRAMSSYVTSEILFKEYYNKVWRCWKSRPTDEQREVIPWSD